MYKSFVFPTLILLFASVNAFAQTTKSRTVISSKPKSETVTVQNSKTLAAAKKRSGSARLQTAGTQRKVVTTNRYNQNSKVATNNQVQKNCGKATPISAGANTGYEVGRPAGYTGNGTQGQVVTKPTAATLPAKARLGAARGTSTTASSARKTGVSNSPVNQTTSTVAKKRSGAVVVD